MWQSIKEILGTQNSPERLILGIIILGLILMIGLIILWKNYK